MALKMKLTMPPMPISHLHEIKIFNDFIKENPSFTSNNISNLAIIFKEKSNGTTVFPKLPSLIKQYYKRWEANSLIQLAQNTMKTNLNELLEKFSNQKICKISSVYSTKHNYNEDIPAINNCNNNIE